MSDPRHVERERASAAVRELPRPVADPGFRERLGRRFAAGELPPARRPHRPRGRAWLAAAAVLAVVVAASLLLLVDRGPRWQLTNPAGAGALEVDGVARSRTTAEAERSWAPGTRLGLPSGADVEVVLPGIVALQLTPGTELTLPGLSRSPGRGGVESEFVSGEVRVTSGPGFAGRRLHFRTPEAHVEVTGTTLALIRDSVSTCVCVFEGTARMGTRRDALAAVREGSRRTVYRDGRPDLVEEIRPMERMKLGMLRDRGDELFGGPVRPPR